MGAPTKKELAKKRMEEIDTIMRSKMPTLVQKGLDRLLTLIDAEDTAPAVVTRIVEIAIKELKELKEEDLADGIVTENKEETYTPIISLKAVD